MVWKCKHAKKNHILHRFGSLGIFFLSMNPVPYVFSLVFSCWHSWTLICFDWIILNAANGTTTQDASKNWKLANKCFGRRTWTFRRGRFWKSCQRLSHEKKSSYFPFYWMLNRDLYHGVVNASFGRFDGWKKLQSR